MAAAIQTGIARAHARYASGARRWFRSGAPWLGKSDHSSLQEQASKLKGLVRTAAVRDVADALRDGTARYLDCRSEMEFAQGTVPGSINYPYPHNDGEAVEATDFLLDVESEFQRSDSIMIGCRSGVRSLLAAEILVNAGFTGVSNVEGGYLAWQDSGLPVAPFSG